MRSTRKNILACLFVVSGIVMSFVSAPLSAQVNPAEIVNPRLKAAQTAYFPQIKSLYKQINDAKFPFKFALGRYLGLDPSRQPEADARGIEFVFFHERTLLKISGSYNAAFSADLLTQNQRASRTFSDVVQPVLLLASKTIPADVDCDGIGFEISFHVRTRTQNFDYEGKEILVVVFDRADAFAFAESSSDSQRKEILDRSEVYLDGKDYGLALGAADPLDLQTLDRHSPADKKQAPTSASATPATYSRPDQRLVNPALLPPEMRPANQFQIGGIPTVRVPAPQPATVNL